MSCIASGYEMGQAAKCLLSIARRPKLDNNRSFADVKASGRGQCETLRLAGFAPAKTSSIRSLLSQAHIAFQLREKSMLRPK
jgi:hypothetical protein